jgi:hydroxymethylglutaryl-CoA synthase
MLRASISAASDTPDFWRRPGQSYPEHAGRFSGEPGYFAHVKKACRTLLEEVHLAPSAIDHCVFHTPNGKFPKAVAKSLGFSPEQLQDSLVVEKIGNTYAAASLLGLSALLDVCGAGETILLCSYGSGAGADCFLFETTPLLLEKRQTWNGFLREMTGKLEPVTYEEYRLRTGGGH